MTTRGLDLSWFVCAAAAACTAIFILHAHGWRNKARIVGFLTRCCSAEEGSGCSGTTAANIREDGSMSDDDAKTIASLIETWR